MTELMIVAKYFVIPVFFPSDNVDVPQWPNSYVLTVSSSFGGADAKKYLAWHDRNIYSHGSKMKSRGATGRLTLVGI
jgi:hypothetical protein